MRNGRIGSISRKDSENSKTSSRKFKKATKYSINAPRISRLRFSSNDDQEKKITHEKEKRERFKAHDYKMKIDLLVFREKRDIEVFLGWIKNMESFFD